MFYPFSVHKSPPGSSKQLILTEMRAVHGGYISLQHILRKKNRCFWALSNTIWEMCGTDVSSDCNPFSHQHMTVERDKYNCSVNYLKSLYALILNAFYTAYSRWDWYTFILLFIVSKSLVKWKQGCCWVISEGTEQQHSSKEVGQERNVTFWRCVRCVTHIEER